MKIAPFSRFVTESSPRLKASTNMKAAFHFGAGLVKALAISEIRSRAVIRSECRAVCTEFRWYRGVLYPVLFLWDGDIFMKNQI